MELVVEIRSYLAKKIADGWRRYSEDFGKYEWETCQDCDGVGCFVIGVETVDCAYCRGLGEVRRLKKIDA